MLKPYLERRDVRVVGEITPEGCACCRSATAASPTCSTSCRSREPSDADTLRILIGVQRRLEGKHRCGFDLDVLPAVIDLQRRYDRDGRVPRQGGRAC